ncbi:MAG: UDP-glucuronic acid decarboxylase family protein [archaeon]|nr:UDP-glucuronic acid decarboxylase family protein [archaeon]
MSKILITGGSGFIGSHLVEHLLNDKHEIISLDNHITSTPSNLDHLKGNPNLKTLHHDITEPIEILEKIDYIFHMASPASPIDYIKIPKETLLTGSIGTKNMLDLAQKNNARFLLASTSEIYGDPKEHPQKETYYGNVNTTGPRSCYDEAKRFAEALTMAYHRTNKTNVVIARIFNTYGPGMRPNDGRVVPNFIIQSLKNEPVTINGDGSQTRSFCYVTDLVDGLVKLMFSEIQGEAVNLGNPDERTIRELAKIVRQLTASESATIYNGMPENDPLKRLPDITKAKKLLNWEPKIDIETGLKATIEHFKNSLQETSTETTDQ